MNAVHPGLCTDIPPESPAAPSVFSARSLAARLRSLSVAFNPEPQAVLGSDIDERAFFAPYLRRVVLPENEIADAALSIASPIEGQFLHASCACLANPALHRGAKRQCQ
jgi:hypothetical protein